MCMRFGSDGGRDFLSTSDPEPSRSRDARNRDWRETVQPKTSRLQVFLEQFYFRGGARR
jgi:hypothetical protein